MPGPEILTSSVSEEAAFRDTQVDEYYNDLDTDEADNDFKSIAENPYPGIRPFKSTEYLVFFGRDGISSDLIRNLSKHRFLPVLGSSGTGKSSLIRAGLLPVLETIPGKNGCWKVVICRPGKNPFGNLARAIFAARVAPGFTPFDIWKVLSSSSYGYQQLYTAADSAVFYNTLIIIDQFEELFRYRNDYGISGRNDAAMFVKMLIDTSKNEKLNTYVLITMRSEYLGDCVQLPQLVDAINKGQYLVPRLKSGQLVDVIEQPADFSGAGLEEGFALKIIGEIGDNMDQLPVLQHVLRRVYEHAKKRAAGPGNITVTYDDYLRVGGMEEALNIHANEVYQTLSEKQQHYCRILFQSITDKTTDSRGIRRPLTFATILSICMEKEPKADHALIRSDLEKVVDSFRQDNVNFLMPPPHVKLTEDLEIDISHESLMRTWKAMQPWIDEEARDAAMLEELLRRDKTEYIDANKVILYDEWQKRKNPTLSWARLYKSSDVPDKDFNQKFGDALSLITLNKNRRKNSRLRIIGVAALLFIFGILVIIIYHEKNEEEQKNAALQVVKNSLIRSRDSLIHTRDSLTSNQVKLDSTITTISKKQKSLDSTNRIILYQKNKLSEEILKKNIANDSLQVARLESEKNYRKSLQLNQELTLATESLKLQKDSLETAYDLATKLQNFALAIKHSEKSLAVPIFDARRENIKANLALLSYQLYLQSGEEESKKLQPQVYAALYEALKRQAGTNPLYKDVWPVTAYKNADRNHLAFAAVTNTADKKLISYLTAEDKKFYSFDFNSKVTQVDSSKGPGLKLVNITASPGGRWVALNTLSKNLRLIDEENNRTEHSISLKGIVRTVRFSNDEATLYAYSQDSVLTTINLKDMSGQYNRIRYKLEDFCVSDQNIYGLTSKGEIIQWDKNAAAFSDAGKVLIRAPERIYRGTAISCTADDGILVWGNEGGQVFYKKKDSLRDQYLTRFNGPITSIVFDKSLKMVAVAGFDKTIQVFNLPNLQSEVPLRLDNNEGPVTALSFQKDAKGNSTLLAIISPGLIREYQMDINVLACKLYNSYKDKPLTAEEANMYMDKAVKNVKLATTCQE